MPVCLETPEERWAWRSVGAADGEGVVRGDVGGDACFPCWEREGPRPDWH